MDVALMMACAYGAGTIPTGVWLGKAWKGVDVREHGSGNMGATNVFRVLGKAAGITTFTIDFLKGFLPVLVASHLFPNRLGIMIGSGLLAILGHMTSPWVRFRGGKGVATSAGVFAALLPGPFLGALAMFLGVLRLSGYVSLGSLVAAVVLAIGTCVSGTPILLQATSVVIAGLVFWTHRGNIRRLRSGTENRIQWGKSKS